MAAPNPVTRLTATATTQDAATGFGFTVDIVDASSDETHFKVDWWDNSSYTQRLGRKHVQSAAGTGTTTGCTVNNLLPNKQYWFKAWAVNGAGESLAVTDNEWTKPGVPTSVTAVQGASGSDIDVDCDVPVGPNSGAASYKWEYSLAGADSWTTWGGGATTKDQTITGLDGETSYDFRVSANSTGGTGVASATVTVETGVGSTPWSQDLDTDGTNTFEIFTFAGRQRSAFSFVPTNSGDLTEIQLYLNYVGAPTTETFELNIRDDNSGAPGNVIGTIDGTLISSLSATGGLKAFEPVMTEQLVASSTYHVELHWNSTDSVGVDMWYDTFGTGVQHRSAESISWTQVDATAEVRGNISGTS